LPPIEYGVVLVILAVIIARGFLPGVVVGLVLAVVLFAISYGRVELVREVAFGETYRSNVDGRAPSRAAVAGGWCRLRCTGSCSSAPAVCWSDRHRIEAGRLRSGDRSPAGHRRTSAVAAFAGHASWRRGRLEIASRVL
jgi:MFS superfamily sulfate permease-like transporter